MKYCTDRSLRQQMHTSFSSRNFKDEFDNSKNILEIVELRLKKAKLLGFSNFSEYKLKRSMAETPKKVLSFLEDLLKVCKPKALKDIEDVKQLALEEDGIQDFQAWDYSFYSEKLMEKQMNLNSEKLREFFPLKKCLEGLFEHSRKLYNLEFKESKNYTTYEDSVKVFEIYLNENYQGLLYLDLFSREIKTSGAWATAFKPQGYFLGEQAKAHAVICCNFSKPTEKIPSLLDIKDVVTLFHEFGHALHQILSNCEMSELGGTSVLRDFVELPSQIMENWVYEKEGLELVSGHYKTGKPLPEDWILKLKTMLKFQSGYQYLRQLQLAFLDMAWHTLETTEGLDSVEEFEKKATEKTALFPYIKNTSFSCSFFHIFCAGYSSGYYGYKWAEVLEADAFEVFREKGIFHKETAEKFRKCILSRGNTEKPSVLYKKFRGREHDIRPLLKRDGLIT